MIQGLDHVAIEVHDVEPVRRFYGGVLGLEVYFERELPPGGHAERLLFMKGPGFLLEFVQVPGKEVTDCFHLCFQVENVAKVVETLKAAGMEQIGTLMVVTREGGIRLTRGLVQGPVGERLELMGPA